MRTRRGRRRARRSRRRSPRRSARRHRARPVDAPNTVATLMPAPRTTSATPRLAPDEMPSANGIGQRIAEERLHLQTGDAQRRRRRARAVSERGSRIALDHERAAVDRPGRIARQHVDHVGHRHVRRAERQRQQEGDDEGGASPASTMPSRRHGSSDGSRAVTRSGEMRRAACASMIVAQRAGTCMYHWNSC